MANTIEIIGSWPSGETEYVIGTENPSKLPLVSDSDNGDVLTVVNGAWKDAAPTGGGGGGLPPITPADDGSFPVAQDGAWSKVGGYSVSEEMTTIASTQTVATQAQGGMNVGAVLGDFSGVVGGTQCVVVFNGTEYELSATSGEGGTAIGSYPPTFSDYPFVILIQEGASEGAILVSSQASPTISVTALTQTVTPTDDFKAAVKTALNSSIFPHIVIFNESGGRLDYTPTEDFSAVLDILETKKTPVEIFFTYGAFDGMLTAVRPQYSSAGTKIVADFVLDVYMEEGTTSGDTPTLYHVDWDNDGVAITPYIFPSGE